jgi:uncharacterized membrane protein
MEMKEEHTTSQSADMFSPKENLLLYIFGGLILVLVCTILLTYFSNFGGGFGSQEVFGSFGDFIGGTLNPILSFATITLLIWSIRLQRKELIETRIQFERSAVAQEKLEQNQKKELEFYQRREMIENVKSEFVNLESRKNEILSRPFCNNGDYPLSSALIIGGEGAVDVFNHYISDFNYDKPKEEDMPLVGIVTDFISYSLEYNYYLIKLYEIKEYELYIMKTYGFISFIEKLSVNKLGLKMQLNGLALSAGSIATTLPDLKDDHLNSLKTYILERVAQINIHTEKLG